MEDTKIFSKTLSMSFQPRGCLKHFLKGFQRASIFSVPLVFLSTCIQILKIFFPRYRLFSNMILLHIPLFAFISQIFVFLSDNDKTKFIFMIIGNIMLTVLQSAGNSAELILDLPSNQQVGLTAMMKKSAQLNLLCFNQLSIY